MSSRRGDLPFDAPLDAYAREADALLASLGAGEDEAAWAMKWLHPRFRDRDVSEVRAAGLGRDDARLVVALTYAFEGWSELVAYSQALPTDACLSRFERAVEAVVAGDVATLDTLLAEHPPLARERSTRRHHATLLHYVAANGVEGVRQRTPANAVAVASHLLDAGAEPDALADMYDQRCTTMSMLVSSAHPAMAGLQVALAELLLDRGASLRGPGTAWQSAVRTALVFGYLATARALAARAGPIDDLAEAAGLGDEVAVDRLLPAAAPEERHAAFALAAAHGHAGIVGRLLAAGESPDRYNPDGLHAHATPLHHAALGGHLAVVRLLAERGARLDIRDRIYHATPVGWAEHGGHTHVAAELRRRGAP